MPRRKTARELATDLSDAERLKILNEHSLKEGSAWENLDATVFCHHCDEGVSGRSMRIFRNPEFDDGFEVECGTKGCNGSPLDWSDRPWWRGEE